MTIALGLVHAPVTPFRGHLGIDFDRYGRLLEFHLRNGADALAVPMHAGESVSLSDSEKRAVIAFAVKQAAGRVPVIAHTSDAGTGIAAALAAFAQSAGAAAVIAATPYYWTPPPAMVVEHFAAIGGAVTIPLFVHNAPEDAAGGKLGAELMFKLIERTANFAGLVDSSLDWQFLIELATDAPRLRPGFQLVAGNEYMVSATAIGATGMVSTLAAVAPRLTRALFDQCRGGKLFAARAAQEAMAALRQCVKADPVAGLKAALRIMGRDCGAPRPPLAALDAAAERTLAAALAALTPLAGEPRGW